MFQPAHYHQPRAAAPITAPPSSHRHLEHHALRTRQTEHQHRPHLPPPLVLPPLMHRSNRVKDADYHLSGHQDTASPRSPLSACYSSGTPVPSAKSPSLSYTSSKTASPAPLSALVAAAAASSSSSSPPITSPSPYRDTAQGSQEQQPQQLAKKRKGGRGARSMYTAEEKEMRRKISHSAIEKRRRERTNNVLRDLQNMVPWLSKSSKVQKLEILEAAAQYIKELRLPTGAASDCIKNIRSSPTLSASTHVDESDVDQAGECMEDKQAYHHQHSRAAMHVNFLLS
ncbi:hypothetical protein EV175_005355 [Coemansia sp. RSA 1933]|nr:hypothetical protein EV175_005355 [Coemansia sp. RSA 1933]